MVTIKIEDERGWYNQPIAREASLSKNKDSM